MRRLRKVKRKTILPCCLRAYVEDDPVVTKQLAKMSGVQLTRLQQCMDENKPLDTWGARYVEEATYGMLRAMEYPDKMDDGSKATLDKIMEYPEWYIRHELCQCHNIPSLARAISAMVNSIKTRIHYANESGSKKNRTRTTDGGKR